MSNDDNIIDFNIRAVTRDLARRPEIRQLAKVLAMLGPRELSSPDNDPAPIYVYQAYQLIEKRNLAELLMITIQVCKKEERK